ncbi:MAG TPA: sorbosone dehydrogenase family protein [Polyangiaceae bacterium]|nr:sorbosone dehydrogenase family protein [Polyangiaceae bacterium]
MKLAPHSKAMFVLAPLFVARITCIEAAACGGSSTATMRMRAPPAASAAGAVGGHTDIRFEDLPAPDVGNDADNDPHYVPHPAGAELRLPPHFSIQPFSEGDFDNPRWLALAPNGDVFLSDSRVGKVWVLRDARGTGAADARFVFADGLDQPFGMAFHAGWLYVANTNSVIRYRYSPGQTKASGPAERIAVLPGRGYNQHWTRNLVFSPDGAKLFVSVGSESNDDDDPEPRASIVVMNPDGSEPHLFARGLRNPVGMAFHPATHKLWVAVEERDHMGDDLVPDYVAEIIPGGFYGWPFAYLGPHEDPSHKGQRPDLVARTIAPDVLIQAHSAVLGLAFYDGTMFPPGYQGDAFVALHGSWNRSKRTGYKIIRIRFKNGRPLGGYDDFVTGWMLDERSRNVWGRPVGVVVAKDGALLIADDAAKVVWRVSYGDRAR